MQATIFKIGKMRIEIQVGKDEQAVIEQAMKATGQTREELATNALRYYAKLVASVQRPSRHAKQMQSIYDTLRNQGYTHSQITANMIRYRMQPKTGLATIEKFLKQKSLTPKN